MQIMTLELSENPFFFGHKSDLEHKCRILLLIRDQVTLVRGEGRVRGILIKWGSEGVVAKRV